MKTNLKINNFLKNNSSTILTIVGSVGVGITAVMAARDTIRAMRRIERRRICDFRELSTGEKIKLVAPCYIPTIVSGVSTVLCICGANKLNKNVQKSLTSAYVLLDQSYKEYKKSVQNVFGEEGHTHVIEDIADRKADEITVVEEKDTNVFFDYYSLEFFNSTISKIREAEKTANEMLKKYGQVSLRTFYSFIGEEVTQDDDLLGWSINAGKVYDYDKIQIDLSEVVRKDGTKYYVFDFVDAPTEDYLSM